jgi:hypothetical protein
MLDGVDRVMPGGFESLINLVKEGVEIRKRNP